MPKTIEKLDPHTINQIAAGEVILNAASVVKELVDNALDALASKIIVEIKGGGRQLVRVTDNGCGMSPEDALFCFELHATSKLNKIEDLESLGTMGFRGEALASIGAVSKVKLRTREKGAAQGTFVHFEGGKAISCAEVPCDPGTCIEIEDLFFNIPARRKFLKSPRQENLEIEKCLFELSLSHLDAAFSLIVDGKRVLDLPQGESLGKRAEHFFSFDSKEWIEIDHVEHGFSLSGLISSPHVNRPNRTGQFFYLNKRPIQAWQLALAVQQGYGASLPEGRHPLFVLFLELSGEEFDVNVHPQKREVRFRHEGELKDKIRFAILQSVQKSSAPQAPFAWDVPQVREYAPPPQSFLELHETVELPIPYFESVVPVPNVIGTLSGYILIEQLSGGIAVIDQRAAEARVFFEKKSEQGDAHFLSYPLEIAVDPQEASALEEKEQALKKQGFVYEKVQEALVLLKAIPGWGFKDPEWAFRTALLKNRRASFSPSCKKLMRVEAELLLKELQKCSERTLSPQGAPIMVDLAPEKIAGLFDG